MRAHQSVALKWDLFCCFNPKFKTDRKYPKHFEHKRVHIDFSILNFVIDAILLVLLCVVQFRGNCARNFKFKCKLLTQLLPELYSTPELYSVQLLNIIIYKAQAGFILHTFS